ncbi:MAG: hypothetical protein AAF196_00960 [Planctomycetota bacterium]
MRCRLFTIVASLCLCSCTPILWTENTVGVGAFWHCETTDTDGVSGESYEGAGLVIDSSGFAIGYVRATSISANLDEVPSEGIDVTLHDLRLVTGELAERLANEADPTPYLTIPSKKETP